MKFDRYTAALAALTMLLTFAGSVSAQDDRSPIQARTLSPDELAASADRDSRLVFPTGVIDPAIETLVAGAYDLRQPSADRYGLVQFEAIEKGTLDRLKATGVRIVAYQPHNAWLVEWSPRVRRQLAELPAVRWVGPYSAEMKIAPELLDPARAPMRQLRGTGELGHAVEILGFPGTDPETFRAAVAKYVPEARILNRYDRPRYPALEVWISAHHLAALVENLAGLADVYRLSEAIPERLYNRDSVEVIQADTGVSAPNLPAVTPIWDQDLIGTGQIITVMDSGLDRNEDWFVGYDDGSGPNIAITDAESPPLPTTGAVHPDHKVYGYWVQPGATAYDNNEVCSLFGTGFHGTHVSGTVAGDSGTRSTPTEPNYDDGDGMAPNAQLLFQDIGNDDSGCLAIQDFGGSLQQAFNGGARVHSNSWGADTSGEYNPNSGELDHATWLNEDLLVLVAAGNSGPGAGSVGAPATAKNTIAVGYLLHGDSTTPNSGSSRGPTSDGRLKPEIQAPGTSIRSAAGDTNDSGTADPALISTKSGTSMATPAVAGGAALARQYFDDGFYPTGARTAADEYNPSGPLLKAVILNGTNAVDFPFFSNTFGWGRMFLDRNLYFSGDDIYLRHWDVRHTGGVVTGETDAYSVEVSAGEELRVTLAWYDVAGSPGAGVQLVNNLDLEVEAPGGSVYQGNVFSGDESTTGGSPDDLNNVEQVRLTSPASGTYEIRVNGASVPGNGENYSDRQGYTVVLSSAAPPAAGLAAPGSVAAADNGGAGVDVAFNAVTGASGYNIYRAPGNCDSNPDLDYRLVGHTSTTNFTDTRVIGGYEYSYTVRADNGEREGPVSSCDSASAVTSTAACSLIPDFDQDSVVADDATGDSCSIDLEWAAGSSNCPQGPDVRYNVHRSTDPFFTPETGNLVAGDVSGATAFTDVNVMPETTYYYVVRAEDSTDPNDGNQSAGTRTVKATSVGDGSAPGTFTDDPDSVSFMSVADPWSVSDDRASTGTLSYRSAPDDASEYTPNTCAHVTTPDIELAGGGSPVLSFDAFYDIEPDWDGVVVEISTNGGSSWSILTPDGGYPGDFSQTGNPPINICGYPASQGAYNGDTGGGFDAESVDLSAFAGQTVRVRWAFSTDPGAQFEGFYLDNVAISEASVPEACFVSEEIFEDGFEDTP